MNEFKLRNEIQIIWLKHLIKRDNLDISLVNAALQFGEDFEVFWLRNKNKFNRRLR